MLDPLAAEPPDARPVTVLVLTPSIGGHYFGKFLTGLTREVAAVGGRLVLVQTLEPGAHSDEVGEPSSFAIPVAWERADGAVSITSAVCGTYLDAFRSSGRPVVLVSADLPGFEAPRAMPDNARGTRAAVEHLIGHGHTRIGFVGNLAQHDVRQRFDAYEQTLVAHGLIADPAHLFEACDNAQTGGAVAAHALLAADPRPTAVMVATDRNAIGIQQVLTDAGVRMPEDLAIVAFDNTEAAAFSAPSLSSVDQRFDEVGALAGRLVLAQIRGDDVSFVSHTPTSVTVALRESCGCVAEPPTVQDSAQDPASEAGSDLRAELALALGRGQRTASPGIADEHSLAVAEVVRVTEHLLACGDALTGAHLRSLTVALRRLTSRPDVLRRITSAVTRYVHRSPTSATGSGGAAGATSGRARIEAALWKLQAGALLRQSDLGERAIDEQYYVDAGLLDTRRADPRHLGWLDGTHVGVAVLALWDHDDAASGQLRIVGTRDPAGVLPDLVGRMTTAQQFPPQELIAAASAVDHGVCVVVPVRTREHEWGLLCLIGEIDTTTARETYFHWAALLCGALASEQLQRSMRVSEERYALVALATNDGLWEWVPHTRELYVSDRCAELVGFATDDADHDMAAWKAQIHPDDRDPFEASLRRVIVGEQPRVEVEYRFRSPDGSTRWMLCRALAVRDADGVVARLVGSLTDVDERRSLEDKLRTSALHDALTNLPNRRLFLDRLEHSIALWKRSKTPFAVLFLDLDGFKAVNDSLGHPRGDRLLREVGVRIAAQLRSVDTGARFGGDEFAILLHDVVGADVLAVARRVQATLGEVIDLDGHRSFVQASLGIATSDIGYSLAEDILRDADIAMYHAKTTERGSIAFFDAPMQAHAMHSLRVQSEVREALISHQFEVHYQPIVNLASGLVERFEALVRWRHPLRGLLQPAQFLPQLIETGLIVSAGQQILEIVCSQLASWTSAFPSVAVNLSGAEFWHEDLVEDLLELLERYHLTPDRLTFEITESVLSTHPDAALKRMVALDSAGFGVAMDNFGVGHSSLTSLHLFPVRTLKIDGAWVRALAAEPGRELPTAVRDRTERLVDATVSMGAALGLAVIAAGIETAEQLEILRALGCPAGQGTWFAPALPADQAAALLGQNPRTVGAMRRG